MGNASKGCGTCHRELPRSAFAVRRASKDGLQNSCRACNSAWSAAHRPRKLATPPLVGEGEKWCRECDSVKPLDAFALHAKTRDGRQSYCRDCFASRYRNKQETAGKLVRPADIPDDHKFCRGCQRVLPLTEWPRRARSTDGYAFRCRECISAHDREKALIAKYGMTAAEVDALRDLQGGVCAICRTSPAVHVDHDHETGKVRGMLCFSCNAALGHFKDDPTVLGRAARYVARHGVKGEHGSSTSRRDEVAWEVVLGRHSAGDSSLLEQLFAARLAGHGGGPAA